MAGITEISVDRVTLWQSLYGMLNVEKAIEDGIRVQEIAIAVSKPVESD